jgi:outer membrane protein OmpA-like peptidoglycan-associated protein
MTERFPVAALSILILLLLTACSTPQSRFVVLPSPDGKVGMVQVSTEGGEVTLNKAYASTTIERAEAPPPQPVVMSDTAVVLLFKDALEALPPGPVAFILYFEFATVKLTGESEKTLSKVLEYIQKTGSTDITVIGHADKVGSKAVNARISSERALSIAAFLKDKGVAPSSIRTDYYGDTFPLVDTPRGVREPRNRRVEVTVR